MMLLISATSYENILFMNTKSKMKISCTVTAQLISAFEFALQIVQLLYLLNPKIEASSLSSVSIGQFVSDLVSKSLNRFADDATNTK